MQKKKTGVAPSKTDLFVLTHKKKNKQTGEHDGDWIDTRSERSYGTLENLRTEQIRSQADSADTPLRSDDELLLEAVGGVYKKRLYGHGPLPPRPRSVYASASTSTAVSHEEYETMRNNVAELTLSQANMHQEIQQLREQHSQEIEQRLREQAEQFQQQQDQRSREQAEQSQRQLREQAEQFQQQQDQRSREQAEQSQQQLLEMFAKFQSEHLQKKSKKSKKNPEGSSD